MAKKSIMRVAEMEKKIKEIEDRSREEKEKILKEAYRRTGVIANKAESEIKHILQTVRQKIKNEMQETELKAEKAGDVLAKELENKIADRYERAVDLVIEVLVD